MITIWKKNTRAFLLKLQKNWSCFCLNWCTIVLKQFLPWKTQKRAMREMTWKNMKSNLRSHYVHSNPLPKYEPPKAKKERKKTHAIVVLVLWATELCQTHYLLFPRYSGKVPWDCVSPKTDKKTCHLLWHVFMGYYKQKACMRDVKRKAAGMFSFDFTSTQKILHLTKQAYRSM